MDKISGMQGKANKQARDEEKLNARRALRELLFAGFPSF